MASIQLPQLLSKAYQVEVFPAPQPAQAPQPKAQAAPAQAAQASQNLPTDTVTISPAGLAASQNYLQNMLQLYQDTDEQLTLLAQGGDTLAQELLTQRQAAVKI